MIRCVCVCVCVSRGLFSGCDVSHNNRHTKSAESRQGPTLSVCEEPPTTTHYHSGSEEHEEKLGGTGGEGGAEGASGSDMQEQRGHVL